MYNFAPAVAAFAPVSAAPATASSSNVTSASKLMITVVRCDYLCFAGSVCVSASRHGLQMSRPGCEFIDMIR